MSQLTNRARSTKRAVSSKKQYKRILEPSPAQDKTSSTKKATRSIRKVPLPTDSIRTRAKSVTNVNDVTVFNSSVVDSTTPQLYQRITTMTESVSPPNDAPSSENQIISEYLWRLGDDRPMFEQHFDISSFLVLGTSPIATQLNAYLVRLQRRHATWWTVEWIATLMTVRFTLDENSAISPARPDLAARLGDIRLLKWLTEHGRMNFPNTTRMAVWGGHLECLKYATENGFRKNLETTSDAARMGLLDHLKYATEQGFHKHERTTWSAASNGHLNCLQYATENGFQKFDDTTEAAAGGGYLNCLKYATEHGFEKSRGTAPRAAAGGHLECLKYATEQGFEKHPVTTLAAAGGGHLDCLIYATEHGYPKDPDTIDAARRKQHWDCLRYAVEMGYPEREQRLIPHHVPVRSYRRSVRGLTYRRSHTRFEDEDDEVEDENSTVLPATHSFVFPADWNNFSNSRMMPINIEMPMEGFSLADMHATTRERLEQLFGKTCYNVMEAGDVSMQDFLEEDKRNHVVALSPQTATSPTNETRVLRPAEAMTRDQLVNQKADLSAQFYPCVGRGGTFPVDTAVRFIKLPLSYNPYVPESDLDAMLSATHSSKQMWELTDSGLDVGTMASGTAVIAQEYQSAHHCQSGTGRRIYRLSAIDIATFYVPRLSTIIVDESSTTTRRLRPPASNSSNNNNNSKRSVKKSKTNKA